MALLGACSLVAGCAGADPMGRQPVSGRITIEGAPLDAGAIMLDPGSGREGTAVGGTIRAGAFSIGRDRGPTRGTYKVRIYASSDEQAPVPKGASDRKPRPMIERIPARYNLQTEQIVEIRADRINRIEIDVQLDHH